MVMDFIIKFVLFIITVWNSQIFVRSEENEPSKKLILSLFKIITEGEDGPRENDMSQYVIENYNLSYQFTFNNGAKCKEIRYWNKSVWSYDPEDPYPRAVCVHLDLGQIFLQIGKFAYMYQYDGDVWNPFDKRKLSEFSEEGIEIITEEDNKNYKVENFGISVYHRFDTNTKCREVRYKGNTVWRHGEETNNMYPSIVYFNFFKKITLIDFKAVYLILNYRENGTSFVSKTEIDKSPTSALTVITNDENGLRFENDYSKYQLKKYDLISEHVFTSESKCVEFKFMDQVVWKYSEDPNKGYPKSLCFHEDLRLIFLELNDSTNTYKCGDNGCVLMTNFPLNGFDNSKLSLVTENNENLMSNNDPTRIEEKSFGFGNEYIFKKQVKCLEVKYDNKTVWTHENSESENKNPKKVFFHLYTRMLILDFSNFYFVYQHDGNSFNLLCKDSLGKVTDSDFTFMSENGKIYKNKDYNFIEYPYGYAAVVQFNEGVKCNGFKYKDQPVWKAESGSSFPKVLYVNWDMKIMLIESPTFMNAYMYINKGWVQIFKFPEDQKQPDEKPTEPSEPLQSAEPAKPKEQGEDKSSLRGTESDNKNKPDSNKLPGTRKKTIVIIVGSVVTAVLLLCLAVLVFYYLR